MLVFLVRAWNDGEILVGRAKESGGGDINTQKNLQINSVFNL